MTDPAPASSDRLPAIDVTRGLIMLFMAMDHVGALIIRRHSSEYWGGLWTRYGDDPAGIAQFVFRLLSDLCAPGFSLWMGAGAALLMARRADWTGTHLSKHWALRGLMLVAISQFIEIPAWVVGMVSDHSGHETGGWPGAGPSIRFAWTVITCLGISMILLALLRPILRSIVATLILAGLCFAAVPLLLPPPTDFMVSESPFLRVLAVAGQSGHFLVEYPILPWLGMVLVGFAFGRWLATARDRAIGAAFWIGAASLLLALFLRYEGGIANLRPPRDGSLIEFLNLIKYPPSLVLSLSMGGINLMCFGLLSKVAVNPMTRVLQGFGRAPLVFYVAHLWLFALVGAVFFRGGSSYGVGLLVCAVALVPLYRLCVAFDRRRRTAKPNALLRLI